MTPSLILRSNWSRHSLEANLSGVLSFLERLKSESKDTLSAGVTGKSTYAGRLTWSSAPATAALEDRSPSDFPANAAGRVVTRTREASLEGNHTFNRVTLTLRGNVSQEQFGESTDSNGAPIDISGRDFTEWWLTAHAAYELQPRRLGL